MAESGTDEQKLPTIFNDIWKKYEFLETTNESTNSDKVQGTVHNVCEICRKAVERVNNLQLFSKNEDIEEVQTNEIKYMLLPALMGYFLMKNTVRDRLRVVRESQDFYMDYIRLCKTYSVTDHDVPDIVDTEAQSQALVRVTPPAQPGMPSPEALRSMGMSRANKVQRYREQKEIEKKLNELRDDVEKDHVDDEVKRDYYISMLKRWVNLCIDELDSIQSEIGILELMAKRKQDKEDGKPVKHTFEQKKSTPLRPFIITKDMLQKHVYGLGYPSMPTVTIEEFCQSKLDSGELKLPGANGHNMMDWAMDPDKDKEAREGEQAEKEARQDVDDEGERHKAQEWDEYKDEHRRGWGNRKNMG